MSILIIINGEEELLKERMVYDEIQSYLTSSVHEFDNPEDYLEESSLKTIDNIPRIFVIWNAKAVPELPSNPDDILILVADGKRPIVDARSRRTHSFPQLKSFDDNNEIINWILKEGESLNIDLTRIAGALFVNCGKSLRKIESEIKKLAVIVPPGTTVTPEQARTVMCFSSSLTPKNIIDSICDGKTSKAIAFYDRLQEFGDETGWIIAYMQRHVIQQIKLDYYVENKVPNAHSLLEVHPFIYKKMIPSRLKIWKRDSLLQSLDILSNLDISHKRGDQFARFGLELEIVRLSEEAHNGQR